MLHLAMNNLYLATFILLVYKIIRIFYAEKIKVNKYQIFIANHNIETQY